MMLAGESATLALGRGIAGTVRAGDAILLDGGLGAGKTTLARGLLEGLGLAGEAPSPSFPILIDYAPPAVRLPVAHVDLYRIAHPDELEELGLTEARAAGLLLVEWPDHGGRHSALADALHLHIEEAGAGRRLTARVPPSWGERWPPR